ncbi:MAG TPA: phosphonoacetaldehyde hydrolase [Bacteroidales bacterium]
MKTNIKAVILDWAGTSVDFGSMAPVLVFQEVFKEKGIDISPVDARKFMGLDKRDHTRRILNLTHVKDQWLEKYGFGPRDTDVEEIFTRLEPKLADVAADLSIPIQGAIEFVDEMHALDIKVGTTTGYVSSMMERIVPEAKKRGFDPDCVVSSSDVPGGRPFPYMCFLNAIKMEVFPLSHMIKIGDTVADILEGLNAGMWTIGLSESGNEVGLTQDEIYNLDPGLCDELIENAGLRLKKAGAHYIARGIWECLPIIKHIEERIRSGENPLAEIIAVDSSR